MDLKNEQYKIIDNYLTVEQYRETWNFVKNANYKAGEVDYEGSYPIGMVAELPLDNSLFPKQINNNSLSRSYINYYGPRELSAFHIDNDDSTAVTLLYYPCPTYDLNEGGATELIINKQILGVLPIANRLLAFKSNILHRATPFKSHQRWTIAFKYETPTWTNTK